MMENNDLWFENVRLDLRNERLWREQEELALTPKAFALLRYLVEHAGQLVTRTALLEAIWPDAVVGQAVLTMGIAELRKALGDNPQTPRFIETVHRRGYRFLPAATTTPPVHSSPFTVHRQNSEPTPYPRSSDFNPQHSTLNTRHSVLVGRATELAQLRQWLAKSLHGERQIVFVTGEAGIGKTALVETFLAGIGRQEIDEEKKTIETKQETTNDQKRMSTNPTQPHANAWSLLPDARFLIPVPWISYGHCMEHYGTGEAYLPVFTALSQLARPPQAARLREILTQYAPTWLAQMPALLDATALEAVRRRTQGVTQGRMLREITEALEALTVEQPLVMVLEDLHWSGDSTLDLLSFVARRRQPARLLVLGTYRRADVTAQAHPLGNLVQDLHIRGQCEELSLERLPEAAVAEYLSVTFPRHRLPSSLGGVLHRHTRGNPLFLVNVVQDWIRQGVLAAVAGEWQLQSAIEEVAGVAPPSLRHLLEQQLERLSLQDQRLLEAASVAGEEFSAAVVAAAVEENLEAVEERCETLVRRAQVLEARGTVAWPDGTVATRYGFTHALYEQALYERVAAGRRVRLHQQIGQRLEAAYGAQAEEAAVELAIHFERGREYERAIRYLEHAARRALRRGAPREAIQHLRTALRLLEMLPDTPERAEHELALQTLLAPALMAAKGYGAPDVEQVYSRVRVLCQQIEESPQLFPVLVGVAGFYSVRAEYRTAQEIAEQLMRMAQREQDPGLLVEAHAIMGVVWFYLGEFTMARTHLEQGMALYDPQKHRAHAMQYGQDPWVVCRAFFAWMLWLLGYPEQALQRSREAVAYAQELGHPLSFTFALHLGSIVHNMRCEPQAVSERAEAVLALAREHGLPYWAAQGGFARGQILVQQGQVEEGLAQMRQVAEAFR